MDINKHLFPTPTDDFGVLWALAGIQDAAIVEYGPAGTAYFNTVINFGTINAHYPKGVLFTTGLEQEDVVMGGDQKLIRAVTEVDQLHHPKMISVVATAITSLTGMDLEGLVHEIQPRIKAKLFAFEGGGFRGAYTDGIKDVFSTLARKLVCDPQPQDKSSVNIIGSTMESFNVVSDQAELVRLMAMLDLTPNVFFTNKTNVARIQNAAGATLNLVVRDIGMESAEILQQCFNTPYYYGLPFGINGTIQWLKQVAEATDRTINKQILAHQIRQYGPTLTELTSRIWRQNFRKIRVAVCCPYDYALGLTSFIQDELGLKVVLVYLPVTPENPEAQTSFTDMGISNVLISSDEEKLRSLIKKTRPHILFCGADVSRLAENVPIHIRAAMPAYDYLSIYDQTPFIGFRGALFLTQTIVNTVSRHKEILV